MAPAWGPFLDRPRRQRKRGRSRRGGEKGRPGEPRESGYERSNLGPEFQAHGVDIGADLRPEQSFFTRSDNIVFVKKGIVGHTLSTGGDNPNSHQVSDEADTLDFDHMQTCAQLALDALRLLADGVITPTWNEGEPNLGR